MRAESGTSTEDLPPEMIERVSSWCNEPLDLLNLRLVNKVHRCKLSSTDAKNEFGRAKHYAGAALEPGESAKRGEGQALEELHKAGPDLHRPISTFCSELSIATSPEGKEDTADVTRLERQLPGKQFKV
jgi:hypothetical protein